MARQITSRQVALDQFPIDEGTAPKRLSMAVPAQGQQPDQDYQFIGPQQMKYATNVLILKSSYLVRPGIAALGAAVSGTLVSAVNLVTSDGTSYMFRFKTTGVELFDGINWVATTGITLTGTIEDVITYAAWDDQLIFSNGKDGTYIIDPTTNTGSLISAAPIARQLTVTGGRLIIAGSPSNPNTIYWSVKNDYTDFSGLGSGSEDLKITPGGFVDSLTGVYPITDFVSAIVRSNSIWAMSETGNFDAPFQFTKSIPNVGSDSPLGIVPFSGGLIVPGRDNIWEVSISGGAQSIAGNNIDFILGALSKGSIRRVTGVLLGTRYYLFVPNSVSNKRVHVCHRADNLAWTTLEYPFDLVTIAAGTAESRLLTDELTGLTDQLTGLTDDLGVNEIGRGLMLVPDAANACLIIEDETDVNDPFGRDVTAFGVKARSGFMLQTGIVTSATPFLRSTVNDMQALIQADRAYQLTIELSGDGGQTWEQQKNVDVLQSAVAKLYRAVPYAERDSIVVRIWTADCGASRMILIGPKTLPGADVIP